MKTISTLIITLLISNNAFGQMACLGFPSADHFDCLTQTGDVITIDIPAGFGCMQSPISGTIITETESIKMYSPSASYIRIDGESKKVVNYFTDSSLTGDKIQLVCEDHERVQK